MKGFILSLRRVGNEDMIVTLLSEKSLMRLYRFYGARHSILQLGYLIDFEVEESASGFLPRLRHVTHIGFPWLYRRNRLALWHSFVKIFEAHLRDTEELEPFYFDTLLDAARRWERQNPHRVVCEKYISILKHEGRLHSFERCYICEKGLGERVSLMRAFIPAHPECIYASSLDRGKIEDFFECGKSTWLEDDEVEALCNLALKGL